MREDSTHFHSNTHLTQIYMKNISSYLWLEVFLRSLFKNRHRIDISRFLGFTRRKMKTNWKSSSWSFVVFGVILIIGLQAAKVAGRCVHNELEICSEDLVTDCVCRRCISCPKGYGLNKQCGGQYKNGTHITCVKCKDGLDYSEARDISTCQPCPVCGGRKTLKKCTSVSKTVCSMNECKEGYVMNTVVDDCVPKPSRTTRRTTQLIGTLKPSTMSAPIIQPKTTGLTTVKSIRTKEKRFGTTTAKTNRKKESSYKANNTGLDHAKDNKILLIALTSIIIIALIGGLFVLYILKKRLKMACFHSMNRNIEENVPLKEINATSAENSQESVEDLGLWPVDLCLRDIPDDLSRKIAIEISQPSKVVKGWREIGKEKGLDSTELNAINIADDGNKNKGEQLFIKFEAVDPNFKLDDFILILKRVGRKDIVEMIKKFYRSNSNTAIQL